MNSSTSIHKMKLGMAVLLATCVIAVFGYVIAGWSALDSVYMVAITIFGVGYGEVRPISDPRLKLFTLGVVVTGCSSGIYVLGGFVQMIAEGEIQRALGARRMSRGIEQTTGHAIICGYGRVGRSLVQELRQSGVQFVVVDRNTDRLVEAERAGILVVSGDASDEATLRRAGIDRATVLATVLPGDAENVFVTLTARELSESIQIIARGESEATERKLIRSGANRVVLPTMIGASKIAHLIACPTVESLVGDTRAFSRLNQDLDSFGLGMMQIPIGDQSALVGSTIREIELTGDGGHVVVAIKRAGGHVQRNPKMDDVIGAGDQLIVLSHKEDLPSVSRRAAQSAETMVYRGTRHSG
ncbi:potassium channel protein [Stieleria sp. TO1_6]|uniref:potassium channel family protein n=1 Tax=Stieleria tagensis TaxID=2956795 RepID=UPI00209B4DFA|nr:potassium channel protein [Stieleria tagensis]MCO8124331.1 potassium channel protein [Stieleria tagensis]